MIWGLPITLSCLNIVGHVSTSIGPFSGLIVNVRRFSVNSQCWRGYVVKHSYAN